MERRWGRGKERGRGHDDYLAPVTEEVMASTIVVNTSLTNAERF
jgi:hypothetical protein